MAQPATCKECGRACKSKNALRAHQRCHNKKYFCYDGECARKGAPVVFGTRRDLVRHQRTHTAHPKIQCHYCHAVVGRADNLKRHIDAIHKGGIHMAAASGNEEAVMSCLVVDTKFALEKDRNGNTALCLAILNGHEGVARILLDTWGGTEYPADDPRPAALWLAGVHERHDIAKLLISRGAGIDLRNGTRPQVLIQAAKEGNLPLVRRCLEIGVAINVAGRAGETALGWAIDNRDEEMTKHLISKGAIAHHASLLVAAAKWGHAGLFGVLLDKTHQPSEDTLRSILLHPESQHEDILQLVVRKWLELDGARSWAWQTILEDAAKKGCEAAVRVLLDNGARSGYALGLRAAAGRGYVEILRLLLEQGEEVNDGDGSHNNPLHCAALHGHPEAVRLLLDRGVKIDAVDWIGRSALHYAAQAGHLETVQLLLERGTEIDVVGGRGPSALHYAAEAGHLEIVRLLLERGTEVDVVDWIGRSALHYAAEAGHLETVRLLLERGTEVDVVDWIGRSALHYAAEAGHLETVRLLLERGAEVDVIDGRGKNALHCAAKSGYLATVRLLLERGADREARTIKGLTPLQLAPRWHPNLKALLE